MEVKTMKANIKESSSKKCEDILKNLLMLSIPEDIVRLQLQIELEDKTTCDFSFDDVKEIVFSGIMTAYNERKQLQAYIKQLEEKIKGLEAKPEDVELKSV